MRTFVVTMAISILSVIQYASAQDDSNNRFAVDFFKQVSAQEKGNIFFSPFSLSSAMAMTFAGAKELTEVQIGKVFYFPVNSPSFHKKLGKTMCIVACKADSVKLDIVNSIWAEKTYPFKKSFNELIKKSYSASITPMNFISGFEESRKIINDNIYKQTNEKIKDLLPPGSLNSLTKLVLTNAIYFKGNWKKQFNKDDTQEAFFYLTPEIPIKIKMMMVKGEFNYYEGDNIKAIEIPYAGNSYSMIIILPLPEKDLGEISKNLKIESISEILKKIENQDIIVKLPKFKFSKGYELKGILSKMGMPQPFTDEANFTGMSPQNNLKISDVYHKAFIEVNEEGSEAAAATAVVIAVKSISRPNVFEVNRPFIFLIREKSTNTILFMGRVVDPTKTE